MTRHLHFDCFNGISGDMTLGALVDLGLDLGDLQRRLAALPVGPFRLTAEKIKRQGIVGTKVRVEVSEDAHPHAHLRHVVEKVRAAGLPDRVTERAIRAFTLIAEAEAHVHGSTVEKIHFHEVGANDAVIDIAGAMLGVELLGIDSFSASPVAVGNGFVQCAHGTMPVPAPATIEILKGFPTRSTDIEGELATPTGAAILRTLAGDRAASPSGFSVDRIGYGAGTREIPGHPNYLRLQLGAVPADLSSGESRDVALPLSRSAVTILETEIDDMSPELAGHLMERLLAEGARDAHFLPVQMKKNRPGLHLCVLCDPTRADRLAALILRETSTFGLRMHSADRYCLRREAASVSTPAGEIQVKIGYWGDEILKVSPEYESCRALAESTGQPLRRIYDEAVAAIQEKFFSASARR